MKHNLKVIFIMVFLFLLSQFIGLYIVDKSIGEELALGVEKPQLQGNTSFIYIFIVILLVTIFALILAKFKAVRLWKIWFFISIVVVLTIALGFFVNQWIALALSLIAAYFKVVKPNMIIHNFSELFLYGGLAAIFVETLSIISISILLILIALYDMYAVWKSKHMITLAKFQGKMNILAGLFIPYREKNKERIAILGGGDLGFPLLFSGVIMKTFGNLALIIPLITALSLFLLLYYGDKNKFYPAMPYLAIGCFVGYGLILLF